VEKARLDWEHALELSPEEALVFPPFMHRLYQGQIAWLEAYYAWAQERLPRSAWPWHGRGDGRACCAEFLGAIADYSTALQFNLRDGQLYLKRGRMHLRLAQLAAAEQDISQAIALARFSHQRRWAEEVLRSLEHEKTG
jgi:tetratricopeptide (TPR) repeat protein